MLVAEQEKTKQCRTSSMQKPFFFTWYFSDHACASPSANPMTLDHQKLILISPGHKIKNQSYLQEKKTDGCQSESSWISDHPSAAKSVLTAAAWKNSHLDALAWNLTQPNKQIATDPLPIFDKKDPNLLDLEKGKTRHWGAKKVKLAK